MFLKMDVWPPCPPLPLTSWPRDRDGIFTGEDFLMFKAPPADIEKFIAGSQSIKGNVPTLFSPEQMHIPYPDQKEIDNGTFTPDYSKHKYLRLMGLIV